MSRNSLQKDLKNGKMALLFADLPVNSNKTA